MRALHLVSSCAALALLIAACGDSGGDGSTTGTGGAGGAGSTTGTGGAGGAGGAVDPQLATLDGYLMGDFDNGAQHDKTGTKLVERHVCAIPGRDGDPAVLWLYVEHAEVLKDGTRDAYYTRVNEIRLSDAGHPVSRGYKFADGHPLATNAFKFNGPRDGCTKPDLLKSITDADLVYRDGCDVTFTQDGDVFQASTSGNGCTFPGGYIQTTATVFADGLDTKDTAVVNGQETGDVFQFRRVEP